MLLSGRIVSDWWLLWRVAQLQRHRTLCELSLATHPLRQDHTCRCCCQACNTRAAAQVLYLVLVAVPGFPRGRHAAAAARGIWSVRSANDGTHARLGMAAVDAVACHRRRKPGAQLASGVGKVCRMFGYSSAAIATSFR